MEIIAGDDDLIANVVRISHILLALMMINRKQKENECKFSFDFRNVYWNSRLQSEHTRIIQLMQPNDTICMESLA